MAKMEKKLQYYEGNRHVNNIKHAQLRMESSKLNAHLFDFTCYLHVIKNHKT
jgi:hypothetical protein